MLKWLKGMAASTVGDGDIEAAHDFLARTQAAFEKPDFLDIILASSDGLAGDGDPFAGCLT